MKAWMLFVLGAVLTWGAYVPVLHEGQQALRRGSLRAFLCVGIAYFLTAVLVPSILLATNLEPAPARFTARGVTFSTLAGVAGAAGALCVILALKAGGRPLYIAPLVFAGAPLVNALVSIVWHPPHGRPHPLFFVGMVLAALGAGMVLRYRPMEAPTTIPSEPAARQFSEPASQQASESA